MATICLASYRDKMAIKEEITLLSVILTALYLKIMPLKETNTWCSRNVTWVGTQFSNGIKMDEGVN